MRLVLLGLVAVGAGWSQCFVAYDPLLNALTCTPPLTKVSGITFPSSVNSGGILYFSSSTVAASTAAWTVNTLLKGGGAGVSPVVTGITVDSSNNISTAGSLSTCVGCTTAGVAEFQQGDAPGLGTTSIKLHAPATVTSYRVLFPAAAATGLRFWTNASSVVTESIVTHSTTTTQALFATAGTPAFRALAAGDLPAALTPTSVTSASYLTATNCSSSAAPAVCAAAAAGSVAVAAAGTTVTVNTTAVTANSQIFVFFDSSLGTKLSVTCNTTVPSLYGISARTAGTSFVITATASITNPACFSYLIVN